MLWPRFDLPFARHRRFMMSGIMNRSSGFLRWLLIWVLPVNCAFRARDAEARHLSHHIWELRVENPEEYHPLHLAAHHGHLEAVRALLESGANPDALTARVAASPISAADGGTVSNARRAPMTALALAARAGHREVARLLVDWGAQAELPGPTSVAWEFAADEATRSWLRQVDRLQLEVARIENAARDAFVVKATDSLWTTGESHAERLWKEAETLARNASASGEPSPEEASRLRWLAAWLDPRGRIAEMAYQHAAIEAFTAEATPRSDYLFQRWVMGHPPSRSSSAPGRHLAWAWLAGVGDGFGVERCPEMGAGLATQTAVRGRLPPTPAKRSLDPHSLPLTPSGEGPLTFGFPGRLDCAPLLTHATRHCLLQPEIRKPQPCHGRGPVHLIRKGGRGVPFHRPCRGAVADL